jgi:hypothetical protein
MATSVVHRISVHATASTAPPTAPALNANLEAVTLEGDGWVTIGSIDRGDDCDIDSESVTITPLREGTTILPPGSLAPRRHISRHAGISELAFTCYDISEEVLALDSHMTVTSHVGEYVTTQTERAVLVERDGICYEYYPSVVLNSTDQPGGFGPGDDAVSKVAFTGNVLGTDDIPGGQQITWYVAGT